MVPLAMPKLLRTFSLAGLLTFPLALFSIFIKSRRDTWQQPPLQSRSRGDQGQRKFFSANNSSPKGM